MNEQLSRLTPFSQQVTPGFAWRTYSCKKKLKKEVKKTCGSPWNMV
jgi:hypothetical protein